MMNNFANFNETWVKALKKKKKKFLEIVNIHIGSLYIYYIFIVLRKFYRIR